MAQHDYNIANATFPNTRTDINNALSAIATNNSGDTAPSTTFANQWWYETDTNKLYIRNEDNDAFIHILTLNQTNDTVSSVEGASALAGIDDQSSSNDDQITITDSAVVINEDSDDLDTRIESNGNTHMLFVDGGNDHVNIGTSSDLGGVLNVSGNTVITTADNTDTLTLISTDADASGGPVLDFYRNSASPAPNDTIGKITFRGRNDNSEDVDYAVLDLNIADETDGTEDGFLNFKMMKAGSLANRLRIETGTFIINDDGADFDFRVESDNKTHMLFVDASTDRVGINQSSPVSTLHVNSAEATYSSRFINDNANPYGIAAMYSAAAPDSGSDNFFFVAQDYNGSSHTVRLVIYGDGDVKNHDGTYGTLSDERIKQNIVDANSQWDDIKALQFKNFKKKDDVRQYGEDNAPVHLGLIAQELKSTSPRLVDENHISSSDILSSSEFGSLYEEGDTIPDGKTIGDVKEVKEKVLGIKYSILYMKAVKALQEAMNRIETLESKVATLEGQ